jgi:hypothetical protein
MSSKPPEQAGRGWWTAWYRATLQTKRTGKPHIFRTGTQWKACLPHDATTSKEAAQAIDFCAGSSITAMSLRPAAELGRALGLKLTPGGYVDRDLSQWTKS